MKGAFGGRVAVAVAIHFVALSAESRKGKVFRHPHRSRGRSVVVAIGRENVLPLLADGTSIHGKFGVEIFVLVPKMPDARDDYRQKRNLRKHPFHRLFNLFVTIFPIENGHDDERKEEQDERDVENEIESVFFVRRKRRVVDIDNAGLVVDGPIIDERYDGDGENGDGCVDAAEKRFSVAINRSRFKALTASCRMAGV